MKQKKSKLSIIPTKEFALPIRKIMVSEETLNDFMTYKKAIKEEYDEDISDEKLAAELIALALRKDRSLKLYKRKKEEIN